MDASTSDTALADPYAAALMRFHEIPPVDPQDSFLAKQRPVIDEVFGDNTQSMEEIMAKPDLMKSHWSNPEHGAAVMREFIDSHVEDGEGDEDEENANDEDTGGQR